MDHLDFLHDANALGQQLLSLVARGSAVIAELLRLSDHIPATFLAVPPPARTAPILFDFSYLRNAEVYDARIDASQDLLDLDEEFRETHLPLLERFYSLFESIYRFATDLQTYFDQLKAQSFVQHTIDGILLDVEGRQLLTEAVYLYGVQLLLLDMRIPGPTRERMIVAYYRYKGAAAVRNIDHVVKLCRATGYASGRRPPNYPDEYFARFPLPEHVIDMMAGRLRSDDIYNHTSAYPLPQHRSTALATQAAMLYVILYFTPKTLQKNMTLMREVVDKHFCDNWVVPFYMGFTADLSDAWEPYKAAKQCLANVITRTSVGGLVALHRDALPQLDTRLAAVLTEGTLHDEYVVDNIRDLLALARDCSVTLRWLLLHRTTTHKKYHDMVNGAVHAPAVLRTLMNTAQFEALLKNTVTRLLQGKRDRWEAAKAQSADRMRELAHYFSGERNLTRQAKNENLQNWFSQLADEISALDSDNLIIAGRKIGLLVQALEDVEEFHQIEASLQVKQFLVDTRGFLTNMIRTANISAKIAGDLDIITDFAFAWEIITEYTALMHERIKRSPRMVLLLRATFLKLSSILSLPLVRITQAGSADDVSVAEYYSSQLVNYVRTVLAVIPKSVFQVLNSIIDLQTHRLRSIPAKIERAQLRDYAQLELRYTLSRATHQVSVFAAGVLGMETTLMGIIKLDPKQLLEDGIRSELVRQVATALHECIDFRTVATAASVNGNSSKEVLVIFKSVRAFEAQLEQLSNRLDGYRQSFEYIQDYLDMYGLRIWQEEFSRIMHYNVEQECNTFLKKQIYDWQSRYQSEAIPIPVFDPLGGGVAASGVAPSINFMGRLVRQVLHLTDPIRTTYVEKRQAWCCKHPKFAPGGERAGGVEVVGIKTFSLLHRSIGVFGLTGADRLISFMIVHNLTAFARMYRATVAGPVNEFVHQLAVALHPTSQFPANSDKLYMIAQTRTYKLWGNFVDYVTSIGQAQLVRRQIANELNFSCKMESPVLEGALSSMNATLVADVRAHYERPNARPYPGNPVLPSITEYLEHTGASDPTTKIYITTEPLPGLPMVMFLFVLSQLSRLEWDARRSTLVCREKNAPLDGVPFVMGVITVLKQFHSGHTHMFLSYLGQYVRASISASGASTASDASTRLPATVRIVLVFLSQFCKFNHVPRKAVDALVPSYIFDRFEMGGSLK